MQNLKIFLKNITNEKNRFAQICFYVLYFLIYLMTRNSLDGIFFYILGLMANPIFIFGTPCFILSCIENKTKDLNRYAIFCWTFSGIYLQLIIWGIIQND